MKKIVGVRFKPVGKMYYFDPMNLDLKRGDHVIVETSRGIEYGEVTFGIKEIEDKTIRKPLKPVLRTATEEDTLRHDENKRREKEAFGICIEKIEAHDLQMKLVDVEYTFDESKIIFYFTADGRIDFRDLVKDLASVFRRRIELRQIGVRDESKTLGSVGMCGRSLCCSQFLNSFMPVSIKMAKEQGLSLNPTKISGSCGRLMCCLKYEQYLYDDLLQQMPKHGVTVMTPDGKGVVSNVALLRGKVKVRLSDDDDGGRLKEYDAADVRPYKPGDENIVPHTVRPVLADTLESTPEEHDTGAKPKKSRRKLNSSFAKKTTAAKSGQNRDAAAPAKAPRKAENAQTAPRDKSNDYEMPRLPGNLEAKVEKREKRTIKPRRNPNRRHSQKSN